MTQSDVRLFADDSLLYREISNAKDTEQLQKDLEALENWEKTWVMNLIQQNAILSAYHQRTKNLYYTHTLYMNTYSNQ